MALSAARALGWLPAALLLPGLLLAGGAAAAEPDCPPRGTPVVRVVLEDPEPRVLRSLPAAEMRRQGQAAGGQAHVHPLGLTMSRVEWRSEITVRSQGLPAGPVCALPAELRLTLVHAEHAIRMAREIPPGGCLYGEVMAHERRHVAVNRRTLQEAAAGLRSTTQRWAQRAEVRAPDVAAAAAMLQQDLAQAIEPVLARLRRDREAGHAAIDTPQEYRRLGQVCATDQVRLRDALRTH
jgi:hypothetical protein